MKTEKGDIFDGKTTFGWLTHVLFKFTNSFQLKTKVTRWIGFCWHAGVDLTLKRVALRLMRTLLRLRRLSACIWSKFSCFLLVRAACSCFHIGWRNFQILGDHIWSLIKYNWVITVNSKCENLFWKTKRIKINRCTFRIYGKKFQQNRRRL